HRHHQDSSPHDVTAPDTTHGTSDHTAARATLALMAKFTRGFMGKGRAERDARLPPGQYDTGKQWPVLSAELTPEIDPATWTFTVEGHVEQPTTWTWDEMHALPPSAYNGDIHCVTTWSKLGMEFEGVSLDTLLAVARPRADASHVVAYSSTGYTTNLPLADVVG